MSGEIEACRSAYSLLKNGSKIKNENDPLKASVDILSMTGNANNAFKNVNIPETGFDAVKDSGLFKKLSSASSTCGKCTNALMIANSVINVAEADDKDKPKVIVNEASGLAGMKLGEMAFKSTKVLKYIEESSAPAWVKTAAIAVGLIASSIAGSAITKKTSEALMES